MFGHLSTPCSHLQRARCSSKVFCLVPLGETQAYSVFLSTTPASVGTLLDVNMAARKEDVTIAEALREGCGRQDDTPMSKQSPRGTNAATSSKMLPLHGLVAISCDVHGVNRCGGLGMGILYYPSFSCLW